ncbi:MAG: hypothetical protein A3A86_00575 [Elusimicrobia bacterium RIFCSPLOWO2_01_FULL_60_11]|nr:MAG: hypothetical protein A3A86_00575 [Elusimicrobia bacterium RIFCSPLOWO2_01_FULL_60_11]
MISKGTLDKILPILKRHQVIHARVFGSFAAGTERPDSDLDMIVEMPPRKTYFDLGILHADLQETLGRNVDLLFEGTLFHPSFRSEVEAHQISIL